MNTTARFFLVFTLFFSVCGFANAQLVPNFYCTDVNGNVITGGCSPLNVTFHDSTTGGTVTSWFWDFGDTSTLASPSHIFLTPGQYTVKLVVNGTDSISKTIDVFVPPSPAFFVSEDTVCSGTAITFTDNSTPGDGAITDWRWSFNDGSAPVTGTNNTSHVYSNTSQPIQRLVPTLLIIDVNGCAVSTDTGTVPIWVLQLPVASIGISQISDCAFPASVTFQNFGSGPQVYHWDFGDPATTSDTSNAIAPSYNYTISGNYLVTLTAGDAFCGTQDTLTVNIVPPVASFTADSIFCRNTPQQFTNTSTPPSATYSWSFGDFSLPSQFHSPFHTYPNVGTYTVTLTTSLGSCTSTATQTIRVPASPNSNFSSPDPTSCDTPYTVTFNADTTSMNVGWRWDFGDPLSGTLNNAYARDTVHTYHSFNYFSVELLVTDIYGCHDSSTIQGYVKIVQPQLDFAILDSGCLGDSFIYVASLISPADSFITAYTWDFGDGTPVQTVTNDSITHQFNEYGSFDISLTITTLTGCTATVTKQGYMTIGTKPTAIFDSTRQRICFKQPITFTDLSPDTVTSWLWTFGDGGGSTEQNPTHIYNLDTAEVDSFNVRLIVFNNGCSDTLDVFEMIGVQLPIPSFDTAYNCINPDSVNFFSTSRGADSLWWDFGDGSPLDTTLNPYHIFSTPGTHSVTLTARNNASGCVVDSTISIFIPDLTAVIVTDSIEACPGDILFFANQSNDDVSWKWDFGDPASGVLDSSAVVDTLHNYAATGFYIAQLTTTDAHGCTAVDTQLIHIVGPTADFTSTPPVGCIPQNVLFTDISTFEGYPPVVRIWNTGIGLPVSGSDTISRLYQTPGNYIVTLLVVDSKGCSDVASHAISLTSPTASIIVADTGCSNQQQVLTGSPGPVGTFTSPVTYFWNFGNNDTVTTTNAVLNHNFANNGLYNVQLTVTDSNGCVSNTSAPFFAYTTPAAFTYSTHDTCILVNGIKKAYVEASFVSTSNAYVDQDPNNPNWHWDLDVELLDRSDSTCFYPYNVSPGTYDVSLTIENRFGCTSTATSPGAVVVSGPTGTFNFTPNTGCAPLTVNFDGHSATSQIYTWDFGDGDVINGTGDSTVTHDYNAPGVYHPQFYIGFQLSNEICYLPTPVTDSVVVTSGIVVNIVEDSIVVTEQGPQLLHLQISPTGASHGPPSWDPADMITPGPGSLTYYANATETRYYTVTVPYGVTGCTTTDIVKVIFFACDEINIDTIPNVFTPDDDNQLNNTFHIKDLCPYEAFAIKIFNRWGRLIWESNDPYFEWDGKTTGGTEASEGVYYYVLNSKTRQLHGYIDLIRNGK